MTLDDLRALADKFFEWPEGSGRQTVTTFSALLFAQHVLQLREKSLGTKNSAGVDALRAAMKLEQEPNNPGECSECHAPVGSVCSDADCPGKAAYRREIGLLTGVPDEQPCDAEVALRAALEQAHGIGEEE